MSATQIEVEAHETLCSPPLPGSRTGVQALAPPVGLFEKNASFPPRASFPTATHSVVVGHDTAAGENSAIGGCDDAPQKYPPGVGSVGGGHEGFDESNTGCHEPALVGVVETRSPLLPAITHSDADAHDTD